jgi:ELWxxDGT repeat protein
MFHAPSHSFSLVEDIASGTDSSSPSDLIVYNNKLFFTANDGTNGAELWSSDGTSSNTSLYDDINFGSDGSNPNYKVVFNNILYFSADDGSDGKQLWAADDVNSSGSPYLVQYINSSGDSNPGQTGYLNLGDSLLYFSADDGSDGLELWVMDNSEFISEVDDINPFGDSHPRYLYNLGDTVIFTADDGSGWEVWRSHHGSSNTAVIQNIQPSFADTIKISGVFNGHVYFGADDGVHGTELWKTDGTSANTALFKDINFGYGIDGDPQWFTRFDSAMYFNSRTGNEFFYSLFKTDGTSAGTVEIKHGSIADNFSVGPFAGIDADSIIIFSGYTDTTGFELWKSDGTAAGTVRLKSIRPTSAGSNPQAFIMYDSAVYFIADDGTNGAELWKTDGTESGTVLVKDVRSGSNGSNINELTVANNLLFFTADDGTNGTELWVSDGTASGTTLLDVRPGSTSSSPGNLFSADSLLYFTADDGTHGFEVWISNGTSTTLLKDIRPGSDGSGPSSFASLGGYVYFSADSSGAPAKLWRTDGTAANTHYFFDVNYGFSFVSVGSRIVFIALPASTTNGFHIWSTDGTTAGTNEVEDFLPGECGYFFIEKFPVHNGRVFYWIDDNISGQELWGSDGTVAGTMKYDIAPGVASSYPRGARGLNPLIFSANDGSTAGREPWALNVPAIPLPMSLLELRAEKRGGQAYLEWKSMSSARDNRFDVQRSADGLRFDAIGFVPGDALNASQEQAHFSDVTPLEGSNYYRIRRTSNTGEADYSNICKLSFGLPAQAKAFPNPAKDVLHISTGHSFTDGMLVVRTMSGQLLFQKSISGSDVINIPVSTLSPGMYHAELSDGDGYSVKLVFMKQ